jgi:hypothetical protein
MVGGSQSRRLPVQLLRFHVRHSTAQETVLLLREASKN